MLHVTNYQDVINNIKTALKNRSTTATDMNEISSRSHMILTL